MEKILNTQKVKTSHNSIYSIGASVVYQLPYPPPRRCKMDSPSSGERKRRCYISPSFCWNCSVSSFFTTQEEKNVSSNGHIPLTVGLTTGQETSFTNSQHRASPFQPRFARVDKCRIPDPSLSFALGLLFCRHHVKKGSPTDNNTGGDFPFFCVWALSCVVAVSGKMGC